MIYLADFYTAATPPAEIKAAGFQGASIYLSHQAGKCGTKAQVDADRAAGLCLSPNFEDEPLQALNGFGQGVTDATFAIATAKELGWPAGYVIFYSVDGLLYYSVDEIPEGDQTAILAYFDGIVSVGGPFEVGVYGGISTVELVCGAGKAPWAWQTESGSDGVISPYADLYQDSFGAVFDQDRLLRPFPLWGLSDPATPTAPATQSKETPDMIVVEAEGTESKGVGPGDLFVLGPTKMACATEAVANAYCTTLGQTPPWADGGDKYRWSCEILAGIPNA